MAYKTRLTKNMWFLCVVCSIFSFYWEKAGSSLSDQTTTTGCGEPLTHFIRCYRNVTAVIQDQPQDRTKTVAFEAFGRPFQMALHLIDDDVGSFPEMKVNFVGISQHTVAYSPHIHYYQGDLEGENSQVHGQLDGNIFNGVIHGANETYYIEPSSKYFSHYNETQVVYRSVDVEFSTRTKARKGAKILSLPKQLGTKPRAVSHKVFTEIKNFKKPFRAKKRPSLLSNTTLLCDLHVVADHTFYQQVGTSNVDKTIAEMVYHVMEVTSIFRFSDFNSDNLGDNIAFSIKEVTIYESEDASGYHMASTRITIDDYLDILSTYNFNDVCLGVSFTHRDYENGVIGLAWMAVSNPYGSPGGLCQPQIYYKDEPHYKGGYYSFNSLLISTLNFNQMMPRQVSSLTLAHEIGHSFGAPHDDTDSRICAPGGLYGHYVMHPFSSSADKPNNRQFSPCSVVAIQPVISKKGYCLKKKLGPTCGNGFRESGEQCDCGYPAVCHVTDHCCTPASSHGTTGCKFDNLQGKYCSPRIHGCCKSTCTVTEAGTVCGLASECTKSSICNGVSPECPDAIPLPDGTSCKAGEGICQFGECVSIVCHINGFLDCQCRSPLSSMCKTCCTCPNMTGNPACVPADWLGILNSAHQILYKEPGQSCNGNLGYCTYQNVCITVDQEFALSKTPNDSTENMYRKMIDWFLDNWVFIVVLFSSFITTCLVFIIFSGKKIKISAVLEVEPDQDQLTGTDWHEINAEDSDNLDAIFERVSEKLFSLGEPKDAITAIARVSYLFPRAPRSVVIRTLNDFNSIEMAVRQLLLRGYNLNGLFLEDAPVASNDVVRDTSSILTLDDFIGQVKSEMSELDINQLHLREDFDLHSIHDC